MITILQDFSENSISNLRRIVTSKLSITMHNIVLKVIEKCAKNFNGYARLALNNHESNID